MRYSTLSILMIAGLLLAACTSSLPRTTSKSTSNELPTETRIAVGTLKLTGTDQDVTAQQAEQLLILWQTYKQLSQSDTAAQAEVDGLVAQIQETMTAGQMTAITDMHITQQDVFTSMQGVTVTTSNSTKASTISVPSGSSSGGGMPAGGPGGAPPDGGGMPVEMGGGASGTSTGQTQHAQTSSGSQNLTKVPSALVEAVIQSLQQKIAA